MLKILNKHAIFLSIILVASMMIIGLLSAIYNQQVMLKQTFIKERAEFIKQKTTDLHFRGVKSADLVVRAYALVQDKKFDQMDYVRKVTRENFDTLEVLLKENKYNLSRFKKVRDTIFTYFDYQEYLMFLAKNDSMPKFKRLFKQDKGSDVWAFYDLLRQEVFKEEDKLLKQAQNEYTQAMNGNIVIQGILILIGLPTLTLLFVRIRRDKANRRKVLTTLDNNNRKYLFDDGHRFNKDNINEKKIIDNANDNLRKAASFINDIANENFEQDWEGWEKKHEKLNKDNLADELRKMKNQLILMKAKDKSRLWITEGLNQLSKVIRQNQKNNKDLLKKTISFINKYISSQLGGIFVLDKNEGDLYLKLEACYAFTQDKYKNKEIIIGEGLLGQAYIEGKTRIFTAIPDDYIDDISSGLGHHAPKNLIIIPLKYNDKVLGMLEIASIHTYQTQQIEFLERAGESLGATLALSGNYLTLIEDNY